MSSTTESHASHHGYIGDKKRYLQRVKRIEGLARGIANMIDEEQYCIHILTQVSALTRSLQGSRAAHPGALGARGAPTEWPQGQQSLAAALPPPPANSRMRRRASSRLR